MRLHKRIMFLMGMFIGNAQAPATLKDIYDLENGLLLASGKSDYRNVSNTMKLFLEKDRLFTRVSDVGGEAEVKFSWEEGTITYNDQKFKLDQGQIDQLLNMMLLGVRGKMDEKTGPVVLRQNGKICVIDVVKTMASLFVFEVYIFDDKPITRELKTAVDGILPDAEITRILNDAISREDLQELKKAEIDLQDLSDIFKKATSQSVVSLLKTSDTTKDIRRFIFIFNGDKIHVTMGIVQNSSYSNVNPQITQKRDELDQLIKEIDALRRTVTALPASVGSSTPEDAPGTAGSAASEPRAKSDERTQNLEKAIKLYKEIRELEKFRSVKELINAQSPKNRK